MTYTSILTWFAPHDYTQMRRPPATRDARVGGRCPRRRLDASGGKLTALSRPPHALTHTHGRTRLTREPSGAIVAHLHPRLARRASRRVAHERRRARTHRAPHLTAHTAREHAERLGRRRKPAAEHRERRVALRQCHRRRDRARSRAADDFHKPQPAQVHTQTNSVTHTRARSGVRPRAAPVAPAATAHLLVVAPHAARAVHLPHPGHLQTNDTQQPHERRCQSNTSMSEQHALYQTQTCRRQSRARVRTAPHARSSASLGALARRKSAGPGAVVEAGLARFLSTRRAVYLIWEGTAPAGCARELLMCGGPTVLPGASRWQRQAKTRRSYA